MTIEAARNPGPDMVAPTGRARRYGTLDALRGVAALVVVLYHLGEYELEPQLVPGGYLAVDFFFVLSGFVIALAYEDALRRRMSWTSFLVKRAIRLYPLALLGSGLGTAVLLLKWYRFPDKAESLPVVLASAVLNGLLLPTVFGGTASHHETFPGNGPMWSLFFEFAINLAWAAAGFLLGTRTLAGLTACGGLMLTALALSYQNLNLGFSRGTMAGGMARVCFGFPLGVFIYRIRARLSIPRKLSSVPLLAVALVAVFALPAMHVRGVPVRDLAATFVILPLIVVLGLGRASEGRLAAFLGDISYPVYVLHYPLLLVIAALHQTSLARWNAHILASLTVLLSLALAILASRFYDRPVRRRLSRITAHWFDETASSAAPGRGIRDGAG